MRPGATTGGYGARPAQPSGPPRTGFGTAPAAAPRTPVGLRKGSRVRHQTLGDGVVLDIEGGIDDGKITVYFQRAGKRKLVARYASLELP